MEESTTRKTDNTHITFKHADNRRFTRAHIIEIPPQLGNKQTDVIIFSKVFRAFRQKDWLVSRSDSGSKHRTTRNLLQIQFETLTNWRCRYMSFLFLKIETLTDDGMDPNGIMGGGPPPLAPPPPPKWGGPCIPLADPSSAFSSSRRLRQAAFGFRFLSIKTYKQDNQNDATWTRRVSNDSEVKMANFFFKTKRMKQHIKHTVMDRDQSCYHSSIMQIRKKK